jgi:hypothetical protein
MSRTESEPPRQNAQQFEANDGLAKAKGGSTNLAPVKECPLKWKLKVAVKGEVNARKPKLPEVEVDVEWSDASIDSPVARRTADDTACTDPIQGRGARNGQCRARAKGWYLVAEQPAKLFDGDDKTVNLALKPDVWIAFKCVDEKSGSIIEALKVKANLTEIGDREGVTPKNKPLDIENEKMQPGGTCKLLEISHDSLLWEAVGDITSA